MKVKRSAFKKERGKERERESVCVFIFSCMCVHTCMNIRVQMNEKELEKVFNLNVFRQRKWGLGKLKVCINYTDAQAHMCTQTVAYVLQEDSGWKLILLGCFPS